MNLREFNSKYPDEASCVEAVRQARLHGGVKCARCGHTEHYWRKGDLKFECKSCRSRQSLRKGTVMEQSNLPFSYWMMAIHLMTLTKKAFSAKEMQRLIGHKRYEPIWYMMHKIRLIMGKRDDEYRLKDYVELDEGFFESVDDKEAREEAKKEIAPKKAKRGRGSEKQSKVLVMVESKEVPLGDQKKHRPTKKVGFLKMKVMEDLKGGTINGAVKGMAEATASAVTDGYKGYSKLKQVIGEHLVEVTADKQKIEKVFPWAHTAISNAKRIFDGIHHNNANKKYVQNYLNEFCYKFNRRYFGEGLFERAFNLGISYTWY